MTNAGGDSPSAPQRLHVVIILSALIGFAAVSTDFYLPAMPTMARELRAGIGETEWTVSAYLIGFSAGQLLWGPIGDRIGRRLPVAIGILLFMAGSAGCALAGSMWAVIAWRVLQAVGAAAGVVLARAMVRDLYAGNRAAQMMSTLMSVMAISPLVGPLIGGQILALSGWRAIFWALAGFGLCTLAALVTLPETLAADRRNREPLARALSDYALLVRDRRLLAYIGAGGFFYGGIYAYLAGSPFAYISYHQVRPEHFGLLFGANVFGIVGSNLLNARIVSRYGSDRLLGFGGVLAAVAGMLVALAAWSDWGGVWGLAAGLFLFISASGLLVANSITGALMLIPERSGAVSALVGSLQYGIGIICSALVGAFADGTPWPMGWVIALAGIGCLLCAIVLRPSPTVVSDERGRSGDRSGS